MIFQTQRLIVRNLESTDFAAFHEMQNNPNVMAYTTGAALSEETNQKQLNDCIQKYGEPNNSFWVWAVVRKSDNIFVGTCAVVPDKMAHEIGYRFLEKYWGNGYGREISDGLIDHCLDVRKLSPLVAYVDVRNKASVKILEASRLNFVKEYLSEEGVLDRFYRIDLNN